VHQVDACSGPASQLGSIVVKPQAAAKAMYACCRVSASLQSLKGAQVTTRVFAREISFVVRIILGVVVVPLQVVFL
jgi:hypothetical protein